MTDTLARPPASPTEIARRWQEVCDRYHLPEALDQPELLIEHVRANAHTAALVHEQQDRLTLRNIREGANRLADQLNETGQQAVARALRKLVGPRA